MRTFEQSKRASDLAMPHKLADQIGYTTSQTWIISSLPLFTWPAEHVMKLSTRSLDWILIQDMIILKWPSKVDFKTNLTALSGFQIVMLVILYI